MEIGLLVSFLSLALSIFFWWNARQQAAAAERTLGEIKSQIIGWQTELNKTAIEMLSSRPEMVVKQTMLTDSKAEAAFTDSLAQIVERLSGQTGDPEKGMFTVAVIERLLKHHETIVLEKQRIAMDAATRGKQ
jgi:hypothetical protein